MSQWDLKGILGPEMVLRTDASLNPEAESQPEPLNVDEEFEIYEPDLKAGFRHLLRFPIVGWPSL